MLPTGAGKNGVSEPRGVSRRQTMIESQIEAKNFIGGKWVPADSGEVYEITNPANPSEVLGTTPKSGKAEAERAIEAAAKAASSWKATLPSERGAILSKAADVLESQADELAELMAREVGKPMGESRAEVARAAAILRFYGSGGGGAGGHNPPP